MKIDRRTLALMIASLCGTCAVSQAQDDATLLSLAESSQSRSIDHALARSPSPSATVLASATGSLSDTETQSNSGSISDSSTDEPSSWSEEATSGSLVGYQSGSGRSTTPCESIPSASCGTTASIANSNCGPGMGWLDFDTLLWWGRGLTNAPMVTGGASTTALPTNPLLGGSENPVGTDLMFGLRADLGFWLDDCQNYGVGGRAWGILSDSQEKIITNGGNSTGIQFFNAANFGETTFLRVNNGNAIPPTTGTIGVLSDVDVFSGELYLRSRLLGDRVNRTDLLTGYTFLRLDSEYQLRANILPANVTTLDRFTAYNTFHGGHLGLANSMSRGRFGFSLSGKVALGNMESTTFGFGNATPAPPAPILGLFAQPSNVGRITRNNFTFIPEMNAKMRYRLGRADLGVGYSLVVLPDVAMAPSQIDQYIDVPFGAMSVSPHPKFNTEAYFLHGLDLGLSFRF